MAKKKYPLINLRESKDLRENLNFIADLLDIKDIDGADPKIIRMAVRGLRARLLSLQKEFGRDFIDVFKFKIKTEARGKL